MARLQNLLIVTAAGVLAGAGILVAQPAGDEAKKTDEPAEVTAPTAKLTPAQMREATSQTMDEIRNMLTRLVELRKLARQSQDVIKLNCVNDKMLLFKQLVNIAEEAQTSMTESIALGDEPARYHFYGQVVLAREKAETLRSDAEGCIGEELDFLGPTRTEVDKPDVADLDRLYDWFDLDDPKYATPFN